MTTRMLIDARHQEETRVAVVKGQRIEEFDFEAAARKQIKGNIYLAKVTRVEPSLQAAFVDYGGNRHGFLAFSEIHPDYYQIPHEDREALLLEEQRLVEEHGARYDNNDEQYDEADADDGEGNGEASEDGARLEDHGNTEEAGAEALRRRRMALRRRYKIQEVIRRRQVMLVQVVKEERGNKGAALTTYISLAGRYSVLMPNTAQGGGISRKIANAADRKRLKTIMSELDLPSSMGAIVRTAGLERTKTEIKRDFDYLTRLWDEIRERTLTSSAPALIYEDSDLIKRAIRDIYTRDIDEVLVDGPEGHQQARNFMRLLMPTHAKKVQLYNDPVPLFHRAGVETQLAALLNPVVTLKSGGYIVINPTEALVAIDVNSGRSTREYNIEETALKTNIEAAEEVARQLRLRDLAGLVVVDFIDMESNGNDRKVERALKEALRHDRARIQVGRISSFGLLEMSRQRLRTGVLEASTHNCPMCDGTGLIRTDGSAALAALRLLEEEAVKGRASLFRLRADNSVAVYMLNRKRQELSELESRYGIIIEIVPDESLIGGRVAIDSSGPPVPHAPRPGGLSAVVTYPEPEDLEIEEEEEEAEEAESTDREEGEERPARTGDRRRRRRRRGGRDRDREGAENRDDREEREGVAEGQETLAEAGAEGEVEARDGEEGEETGDREPRRRRRRRRRGGRRDGAEGRQQDGAVEGEGSEEAEAAEAPAAVEAEPVVEAPVAVEEPAEKPKRATRTRRKPAAKAVEAAAEVAEQPVAEVAEPVAAVVAEEVVAEEAPAKPKRASRAKAVKEAAEPKAAKPRAKKAATTKAAKAEKPAKEAVEAEAAVAEEKPKRTRAKKPTKAELAAAEAAKDAPAAEKPAPKPRGRKKAVKAEEVVAEAAPAPAPAPVPAPAEAPAAPAEGEVVTPRRGWWQRTFGN